MHLALAETVGGGGCASAARDDPDAGIKCCLSRFDMGWAPAEAIGADDHALLEVSVDTPT
jgi:hypothetical protein